MLILLLYPGKVPFVRIVYRSVQSTPTCRLRVKSLYTFDVYFGIFATGAMAQIDGKLKHSKPVVHQLLAEVGIGLFLLFCFGWQIKKHKVLT